MDGAALSKLLTTIGDGGASPAHRTEAAAELLQHLQSPPLVDELPAIADALSAAFGLDVPQGVVDEEEALHAFKEKLFEVAFRLACPQVKNDGEGGDGEPRQGNRRDGQTDGTEERCGPRHGVDPCHVPLLDKVHVLIQGMAQALVSMFEKGRCSQLCATSFSTFVGQWTVAFPTYEARLPIVDKLTAALRASALSGSHEQAAKQLHCSKVICTCACDLLRAENRANCSSVASRTISLMNVALLYSSAFSTENAINGYTPDTQQAGEEMMRAIMSPHSTPPLLTAPLAQTAYESVATSNELWGVFDDAPSEKGTEQYPATTDGLMSFVLKRGGIRLKNGSMRPTDPEKAAVLHITALKFLKSVRWYDFDLQPFDQLARFVALRATSVVRMAAYDLLERLVYKFDEDALLAAAVFALDQFENKVLPNIEHEQLGVVAVGSLCLTCLMRMRNTEEDVVLSDWDTSFYDETAPALMDLLASPERCARVPHHSICVCWELFSSIMRCACHDFSLNSADHGPALSRAQAMVTSLLDSAVRGTNTYAQNGLCRQLIEWFVVGLDSSLKTCRIDTNYRSAMAFLSWDLHRLCNSLPRDGCGAPTVYHAYEWQLSNVVSNIHSLCRILDDHCDHSTDEFRLDVFDTFLGVCHPSACENLMTSLSLAFSRRCARICGPERLGAAAKIVLARIRRLRASDRGALDTCYRIVNTMVEQCVSVHDLPFTIQELLDVLRGESQLSDIGQMVSDEAISIIGIRFVSGLLKVASPGMVALESVRWWSEAFRQYRLLPTHAIAFFDEDDYCTGHLINAAPMHQRAEATAVFMSIMWDSTFEVLTTEEEVREGCVGIARDLCRFADPASIAARQSDLVAALEHQLRIFTADAAHAVFRFARCFIDNATEGRGLAVPPSLLRSVLAAARSVLQIPDYAHPRIVEDHTDHHHRRGWFDPDGLRGEADAGTEGSDGGSEDNDSNGSNEFGLFGDIAAIDAVLACAEWMHCHAMVPQAEQTSASVIDRIPRDFSSATMYFLSRSEHARELWDRLGRWALCPKLGPSLLSSPAVDRRDLLRSLAAAPWASAWALGALHEAIEIDDEADIVPPPAPRKRSRSPSTALRYLY